MKKVGHGNIEAGDILWNNPKQYIGQYVAYDCEDGACWAKIDSVTVMNSLQGKRTAFIVVDRIIRKNKSVTKFSKASLLPVTNLKKENIFKGYNVEELDEEDIEQLFELMLGNDEHENPTALELGGVNGEMIQNVIEQYLQQKGE